MLAGAALALAALVLTCPGQPLAPVAPAAASLPIFGQMLVYDTFAIYIRGLLLAFALLFTLLTWLSGVPDRDDATEFYVLVLGALVGMCLMVSANHMLIVFLGVEMASVPFVCPGGASAAPPHEQRSGAEVRRFRRSHRRR